MIQINDTRIIIIIKIFWRKDAEYENDWMLLDIGLNSYIWLIFFQKFLHEILRKIGNPFFFGNIIILLLLGPYLSPQTLLKH